MPISKEKKQINIVWFKRDLRFTDHEPLFYAQEAALPILLLYCFEPSVMDYPDSDTRHWRFVYQSLQDMQNKLNHLNSKIYIFHQEAEDIFSVLAKTYAIHTVFSHQEIGNRLTYKRDSSIHTFFKNHGILWKEYQLHGVIRKLKSRKNWPKLWQNKMTEFPKFIKEEKQQFFNLDEDLYQSIKGNALPKEICETNKNFQPGGESFAWRYLDSFIKERSINYSKHISKPALSRKGCSRLSPYLAYGNISMRMVYQYTLQNYKTAENKRALNNFISRLQWHCHFMQKFEDECNMEFENVNKGYNTIIKTQNQQFITAWEKGKTGVPLVDACMRCLVSTGYLNFRMRALVVSFFTFNLWQHWQDLSFFLARQFLDYEPGIHYPQIQMQAGITGVNTIRIYNPVKNAEEHDSEGVFVKKWLPELKDIPPQLIFEPWKLSDLEQELYNCKIGEDYPEPIVDIELTRKFASDTIWGHRKNKTVKKESTRILKKHVNAVRKEHLQ